MIFILLIGGMIVGLVILYLTRPNYRPHILSSAYFFEKIPDQQENSRQFSFRSLLLSPAFYFQLVALLVALLAFYLWLMPPAVGETEPAVGVAIYIDTSASMSAAAGPGESRTRLDLAIERVEAITEHLRTQPDEIFVCITLSYFDSTITAVNSVTDRIAFDSINASARQLENIFDRRVLNSDMALLQREIRRILAPSTELPASSNACAVTHVAVITDAPAPDWRAEFDDSQPIVWLNVGTPIENTGIVNLTSDRSACAIGRTDGGTTIQVEFATYGVSAPRTVMVSRQDGTQLYQQQIDWARQTIYPFSLTESGLYRFMLSDGGGYVYDDSAIIDVQAGEGIRVDWQLTDLTWAQRFGWTLDSQSPDVRVTPYSGSTQNGDTVPTLYLGDGYYQTPQAAQIAFFQETNPLLSNLDLDVAETLGIRGVNLTNDLRLQPALIDADGFTWFALSPTGVTPYSAFIPGLPMETDMNEARFSSIVFINALCWLLEANTTTALFSLTDSANPLPDGTRLSLFPEEGNTMVVGNSTDRVEQLQPAQSTVQFPIWLVATAVAAIIFVVERLLSILLEDRWN